MTPLEYILDGLEAELALERELGVRTVECPHELLASAAKSAAVSAAVSRPPAAAQNVERPRPTPTPQVDYESNVPQIESGQYDYDFVFLHHCELSPTEDEMIGKIIAALKYERSKAPVLFEGNLPRAKIYIILGELALRKWIKNKAGAPGQWIDWQGRHAFVTYSPTNILRFKVVTPAVHKLKKEMWHSLQAIVSRLQSIK